MRSLTVIGRLGSDAVIETTKNGVQYIRFSLATQEFNETETTWFNVTSFDQQIIKMGTYYKKGTQLVVQGELKFNKYTNKENNLAYSFELRANYCSFVGSNNKENGSTTTSNVTTNKTEISPEEMTTTPKKPKQVPVADPVMSVSTSETDDDLPF